MRNERLRAMPAALAILVLGGILLYKAGTNQLALYIHPRYNSLMLISGVVLLAVGLGMLALRTPAVPPRLVGILLVPILVALLVPARPLGASLVPGKALSGTANNALLSRWQAQLSDDSTTWSLLEWTAAIRGDNPDQFAGKPAAFEGFVFRTDDLAADEVLVGRYVVACCTADGTALSMRIKAPEAATLKTDEWVRVEGVYTPDATSQRPLIVGHLTKIPPPDVPYLYP